MPSNRLPKDVRGQLRAILFSLDITLADCDRAERDALQQRIDTLMECPQAIHGSFTRTPNGKCPWCEWEDLQQRIDAALRIRDRREAVPIEEPVRRHAYLKGYEIAVHEFRAALTAPTESKEPDHEQ